MGTIRERCGKFRAEIHVNGQRDSATFSKREDAELWIESRERPARNIKEMLAYAVPAKAGAVYFLFAHDTIIYVGSTGDLVRRLLRHRENGVKYSSYCAIYCQDRAKRIALEIEHVRGLRPMLNKICFSGGDPLERPGRRAKRLRAMRLVEQAKTGIDTGRRS